jgi:17beta-estradiol 17-dehydrogenase / very-long-chain 3-oxoacyl-CoA reductase
MLYSLLLFICILYFIRFFLEFGLFLYGTFFHKQNFTQYKKKKSSDNTWALVTGASDGIGLAFVRRLAFLGFNVILHGRNVEKLNRCVEELKAQFPKIVFEIVVADASDCSQTNIQKVVNSTGGKDLSFLINNVGQVQNQKMMSLDMLQSRDIQDNLTVNCLFSSLVTQALIPALKQCSKGHRCGIINVSSLLAFSSSPSYSIYAATKAYNRSFSLSLSAELCESNIDVQCCSPGFVASNITKEKPSFLVSSADSVASQALNRIRFVDIIPGFISGYEYCGMGLLNFLPTIFKPLVFNAINRITPKPRGMKKD